MQVKKSTLASQLFSLHVQSGPALLPGAKLSPSNLLTLFPDGTRAMTPSSTSAVVEESQPQAGPLPLKRGEIGYVEDAPREREAEAANTDVLPRRHHPADRGLSPLIPAATERAPRPTQTPDDIANDATSTRSLIKLTFLNRQDISSCYWHGIHLPSFLSLAALVLLFIGTIAIWILIALLALKPKGAAKSSLDMPTILVYVVFVIVVCAEALLIERSLLRMRAERFAHKHSGEALPTSLQRTASMQSTVLPVAPWHRPPLPTYATVLANSGTRTGDAEDSEIVQLPPPAYGNIRDSRLLLTGFLRSSLQAQAREAEADREGRLSERPISYSSRDDGWETGCRTCTRDGGSVRARLTEAPPNHIATTG